MKWKYSVALCQMITRNTNLGFSTFTCTYIVVIVDNTLICFWGIRKGSHLCKESTTPQEGFLHLIGNKWGKNWLTTTCFPSLKKTITTGLWLKSLLQKLDKNTSPSTNSCHLYCMTKIWARSQSVRVLNCPQSNGMRDTTSAAPCLPTHKQLRSREYYNLKTIEQIQYMTISVCHLLSFITSLACKGTILVCLWEGGGYLWPILVDPTLYSMNVEFKFKVKGIE